MFESLVILASLLVLDAIYIGLQYGYLKKVYQNIQHRQNKLLFRCGLHKKQR